MIYIIFNITYPNKLLILSQQMLNQLLNVKQTKNISDKRRKN